MPWFKVDDAFHSHPKVLATEPAALGLWVVAGSWSSSHLTGGVVPDDVLPRLLPDAVKLAEELVTAGLWKRTRRGYRFNDWTVYNPSADDAKRLRDVRAEAGRKGGVASGKTRSNREAKASANASDLLEPPSRPVPSTENPPHASRASPPRKRGTRIPDDFTVTPDMVTWARQNAPHVDGRRETDKFTDYWRAKAGAGAAKLDWAATWRNWMRKAAEQQQPRGRHTRQAETDELFDDALARARARDAQENEHDPRGDSAADQVRQGMLPAAGDRQVYT